MTEKDNKTKTYILLITYAVLLYLAVSNISKVLAFLKGIMAILAPFIMGLIFAYVLNILMSLLERKLLYKLDKSKKAFLRRLRRPLAMLLTFVIVIAFITGVMLFVVPQISQSVSTLSAKIPGYMLSVEKFIRDFAVRYNLTGDIWNSITINWNEIITNTSKFISTALPQIVIFTLSLTNGIINFVMGLIISIYLLATKEKIILIMKKLIFAFMPRDKAARLIDTGVQANRTFQGFISGQITEALILGVLVFIGMLIFRFPYAVLCSVLIAITAVIPIFGAWIGAAPCVFIILMAEPGKALWFILFLVILQQLENSLIYPKVVGDSIGLDGLWVLFALIVGGSLFGLVGMLIGIPAFAVLYVIIRRITNRRLKEKNIVVR